MKIQIINKTNTATKNKLSIVAPKNYFLCKKARRYLILGKKQKTTYLIVNLIKRWNYQKIRNRTNITQNIVYQTAELNYASLII